MNSVHLLLLVLAMAWHQPVTFVHQTGPGTDSPSYSPRLESRTHRRSPQLVWYSLRSLFGHTIRGMERHKRHIIPLLASLKCIMMMMTRSSEQTNSWEDTFFPSHTIPSTISERHRLCTTDKGARIPLLPSIQLLPCLSLPSSLLSFSALPALPLRV